MKTVFIVDDSETNLVGAKTALGDAYRSFALPSAERMFKLTEKIVPDLILLDVEMPETDGFEALEILKKDEKLKKVPVIFLTARQDIEAEIRGFELGAIDFITKPVSPPVLLKRIETHIEIDRIVKKSEQKVRDIHNATIGVISDLVESRDKVTGGHIERTQKYLTLLIDELLRAGDCSEEIRSWDLSLVVPSAQLHDVGKISISDLILNKKGKLTDEEFDIMKQHCAEGEKIIHKLMVRTSDDVFLNAALKFAGYHHEKWDGSGYPRGLTGEKIPLEGRIMAVADVYDALITERPYKKAFSHDEATRIIREGAGSHFDPRIIAAYMNASDDFWIASTEQ
ncbi:MAG: response regulator [Oscillospiraceae bacterium]|jgi:putative two-component system response regulator|nr:response regulator [Oscillospiraceae bacterium]